MAPRFGLAGREDLQLRTADVHREDFQDTANGLKALGDAIRNEAANVVPQQELAKNFPGWIS